MRKPLGKLKIGESCVIPWEELGPDRPESDAYIGLGEKIFHMEPIEEGIMATRKTQADYEEWKKSLGPEDNYDRSFFH